MRKILAMIAVLALLATVVGCTAKPTDDKEPSSTSSTTSTSGTTITMTTTQSTTTTTTTQSTTTTTTTQKPTTTTKKPTTTTTTAPINKSWFDERGFKVTPLTNDFCLNDDPEHTCPSDKSITVGEGQKDAWGTDVNMPGKKVVYYFCTSSLCVPRQVVAFDRYTGIAFPYAIETTLEINQAEYSAMCYIGAGVANGISGFCVDIYCTDNYDGVVFCVSKDVDYPDIAGQTLDELIDFDTAEYYFFSANDK